MMKNVVLRASILMSAALFACTPWSVRWTPHSALQDVAPTMQSCIQFYEGDVERIKSAGGVYHGRVTISLNAGWVETSDTETLDAGREEAAKRGGTHCLVVRDESWEETRGALVQAWGPNMATVTPMTETRHTITLLVIRVPEANWKELPKPLRPNRGAEEFKW